VRRSVPYRTLHLTNTGIGYPVANFKRQSNSCPTT
jgi:hypothetical protein